MDEDGFLIAKNYALKLLSFRPRTVAEIRLKLKVYLKKKNIGENISNQVISFLQELKFLDDREFAKWWIKSRKNNAIKGNKIIALELLSKGMDKEIITELLNDEGSENELVKARKIIEKKLSVSGKKIPPRLFKLKISQLLYRKGFDMDVIKKAIVTQHKK